VQYSFRKVVTYQFQITGTLVMYDKVYLQGEGPVLGQIPGLQGREYQFLDLISRHQRSFVCNSSSLHAKTAE
jgi:hypothetical protein